MQTKLFFPFVLWAQLLSAQIFTEAIPPQTFLKLEGSSAAFADVDNDNDVDLLINGLDAGSNNYTKLYVNDGLGHFSLVNGTTFQPQYRGAIVFADVDNDNDLDVLMSGFSVSTSAYAKLYFNDGQGHFSVSNTSDFVGLGFASVAFADVDQDNDLDVLMNGQKTSGLQTTKLYLNNGLGHFTEALNEPFVGLTSGACAFADVDNDNDPDAIITGADNTYSPATKLYFNDGEGHFTESTSSTFVKVYNSAVAFSDIDNDNDPDLLIAGANNLNFPISRLYKNDGQGNFNQVFGTPFAGIAVGSISFSDVDKDNDNDVFIIGYNEPLGYIAKLYINNGVGQFSPSPATPFIGTGDGDVSFADIDNDNDSDLFIIGSDEMYKPHAKLYINNTTTSTFDFTSDDSTFDFSIYPNPSQSGEVNIKFGSEANNLIKIKLFDSNSQVRISREERGLGGEQLISLDISQLGKGVYWLQLNDGFKIKVASLVIP